MDIHHIRQEYRLKTLEFEDLEKDPTSQFSHWFLDAQTAQIIEPNAMSLATASITGMPSSRMVLLKYFQSGAFCFFTSYQSRKAQELLENPRASLLFFWKELERQIIIEGIVNKMSPEDSYLYFKDRPRESQISTWASQQGQPIGSREVLERRYEDYEIKFKNNDIPLPPHWGGFKLIPDYFEFWQGRAHRLHDRFAYRLNHGVWEIQRIAP